MSYEVSVDDVKDLYENSDQDVKIVDVREEWELARGILPGAVSVPLSRFAEIKDVIAPGNRIIIYCEHGIRSLDATMWLQNIEGYANCQSMTGGFARWIGEVESYVPAREEQP